jgi:hypothetical protein
MLGFHLSLLSFFHSGCILMEPFAVLVRDGSHISRAKIQARLQEMEFQRHIPTKAQYEERSSSKIST